MTVVVGETVVVWLKYYTEVLAFQKSFFWFALIFPITVYCFGCVDWGDGCGDYGGGGSGSEACGEDKTVNNH